MLWPSLGVVDMPQRVNEFTQVRLADGVVVTQRGPAMLQFGADATRTGVVETAEADRLSSLFDAPFTPRPIRYLIHQLRPIVGGDAARSLVADLMAYRILVPTDPATVSLIGATPLADALTNVLGRSGCLLRSTESAEVGPDIFDQLSGTGPLVVVDQPHLAEAIARYTRASEAPVVPVTTLDSHVVVGPVRLRPSDPCPACLDAYLRERDAGWERVRDNLYAQRCAPSAAVIAAGAAAAAVVVRRLAGVPDPPGVSAPPPASGECVIADPFGPHPTLAVVLERHPDCTVCY